MSVGVVGVVLRLVLVVAVVARWALVEAMFEPNQRDEGECVSVGVVAWIDTHG